MQDGSHAGGPGVIVVAEESLHALLSDSGVTWRVQPRQDSVAAMWQALSSGALDQHSRILVFSDSLKRNASDDDAERQQTAAAVVAMANAGAVVYVAQWRPEIWADFDAQVQAAARAQGIDASRLSYGVLPIDGGGRAVIESMRERSGALAPFPDQLPDRVDVSLVGDGQPTSPGAASLAELGLLDGGVDGTSTEDTSSEDTGSEDAAAVPPPPPAAPPAAAPPPAARPSLPPIGGAHAEERQAGGEYPPSASLDLLEQPKRPGQTTITVTSSKGGSGKSTASILLAATIRRASKDAGRPLSVCLVDLDTRDGQVASLIGKFMPTALNIRVQPVWDEERIRRNLVQADGLDIDTLLAPIRPRTADTVGPDFYRTIVRSLQRMYDVIVMDTSVQYLEPLIADVALKESDEILFVTTLASTAVQGMARALREITAPVDESGLGIPREKIGIIVNQSVANVGMERDQVLAAGLGVPVVAVIPLATKDVLTATNLNRMYALLDHPLLGPAYNELAHSCLPGRDLAVWTSTAPAEPTPAPAPPEAPEPEPEPEPVKKRGFFRR